MNWKRILIIIFLLYLVEDICSQELEIYFFDVHSGNACLVISPSNEAMIVDLDTSASSDINNILSSKGITSLKYTIASHGDGDHCAGFDEIIPTIDVTNANFYNGDWLQYPADYKTAVLSTTAGTQTIKTNQVLTLAGGVTVRCINVNGYVKGYGYIDPVNDNGSSIGIILSYNNFSIWIGGDTTIRIEEVICNSSIPTNILDVDVYLANHHGDNDGNELDGDGNSQAFINKLKPEVAIISAGRSGFDNPNINTIDYLINAGAYIYQTAYDAGQYADFTNGNGIIFNQDVETTGDYDGDIKIITDGYQYSIVGTITPQGTRISNVYPVDEGAIGSITFTPSYLLNNGINRVRVETKIMIPLSEISNVILDWSSIGGSTNEPLYDDGTHGDVSSNDQIYTFTNIITTTNSGYYPIIVKVIKTNNDTVIKSVSLKVIEDTFPPESQSFSVKFTNDKINLSWQNPKDIDYHHFILRYNTNPYSYPAGTNDGLLIYTSTNRQLENYTITNFEYYKRYYFRIFFVDVKGNYSYLSKDILLVPTSEKEYVKISDNFIKPEDDQVIEIVFHNSVLDTYNLPEIKIFNIKGEIIKKMDVSLSDIDFSNNSVKLELTDKAENRMSSGLYFIVINTAKGRVRHKILIVH